MAAAVRLLRPARLAVRRFRAFGLGVALARVLAAALARLGCGTRRLRRQFLLALDQRRREIGAGARDQPLAELLAQRARLDLVDRAGVELAQLKRSERDADQPVDLEAEMAEHVAHLAVLAFTNGKGEPHVRTLGAVERRVDRS